MAVFRVEKTDNYTVMSNYHLRDKSISLKAKGLLSQMLSLPPEWDYTLQGLAYINKEGINSVREGVKELEKAGYIKRRRVRGDKGLFAGNEYVIRELPESEKPSYENRTLDNRTLENPTYDNETQIKKEREKKEKENIDCINHRIISYQPENDTSEVSKTLPVADSIRSDRQSYEDTLKRNIEYDFFIAHDKRRDLVKEILQIMVDAGCSRNPYIRIGRDEKPTYVVRDRFLKLDSSHIEYVLDCLEKNQQEVRNVKQYITTLQ